MASISAILSAGSRVAASVDRVRVEVEHQVDGGGDHRFGASQDVGARAAADVDQSHQREGAQGLTDRRPAGPETFGKLTLRGQPGSLGDVLADDEAANPVRDLIREPGDRHGCHRRERYRVGPPPRSTCRTILCSHAIPS
jgi:hypothetical protein